MKAELVMVDADPFLLFELYAPKDELRAGLRKNSDFEIVGVIKAGPSLDIITVGRLLRDENDANIEIFRTFAEIFVELEENIYSLITISACRKPSVTLVFVDLKDEA